MRGDNLIPLNNIERLLSPYPEPDRLLPVLVVPLPPLLRRLEGAIVALLGPRGPELDPGPQAGVEAQAVEAPAGQGHLEL